MKIFFSLLLALSFTINYPAFCFAKSKRNIGWMIAYIVFIVLILVFVGIQFAGIVKSFQA